MPLPYMPKICLRQLIISAKLPKCVYVQFPLPLKIPLSRGICAPKVAEEQIPRSQPLVRLLFLVPCPPQQMPPASAALGVPLSPLGLHGGVRDAG